LKKNGLIQRFIWNFEFKNTKKIQNISLLHSQEDSIKWEARFFWPQSQIVTLKLIDEGLLDLSLYQYKQKTDDYLLLAHTDANLKFRHDELWYKPLIKNATYALGYGTKYVIEEQNSLMPSRQVIPKNALTSSPRIRIDKETLSYKFPTTPTIKLELSKIKIKKTIYFSLCVEGRSHELVEQLTGWLLGKCPSSDYPSFLKSIVESNE